MPGIFLESVSFRQKTSFPTFLPIILTDDMNEVYAGKHHFILYQTTQISIHNFSNNITIMGKIFETNPSFHVQ